ncbi:hypothetical protein GCM10027570_00880 [Streptomonospora sediminis]
MLDSDEYTWNPQEIKEKILDLLERGREKDITQATHTALDWLARLYISLGSRYPRTGGFIEFKQQVISELKSPGNNGAVFLYIQKCMDRSTMLCPDQYAVACRMRSVIQIFCDEFMHIDLLLPEPDRGDIEEIDEFLARERDFKTDMEFDVPDWVPAHHWWWTIHSNK